MMAIAQRWICFECAQCKWVCCRRADLLTCLASDSSKACFECTYCQVRFCFACQKRHPSNHSRYLVTLQNATGNGSSPQRCVDCEEMVGLRYICEGCSYAKCLECWRRSGINRHEHQNFSLYELRENYGELHDLYQQCIVLNLIKQNEQNDHCRLVINHPQPT